MSKANTDPRKEYEGANGGPEKSFGDTEVKDEGLGEEGEESDEYGEIDDEDETQERQIVGDEEEEDEGEGEPQSTLTHLLIGNPNGAENEEEEDDEDEGDDDDDDDDEESDEEYVEEEDDAAHPNPKKRSIDEVADKEAQGSKKIKA